MPVSDDIRQERKKLKGKGFKAKWDYFWDYYKIHVIVAVCVILFAAFLIHDVLDNKPYGYYAMMINSGASMAQEYFEDGFEEYADIDTENYTCLIDTSATFNTLMYDDMTLATSQKIMASISAKELDSIVSDIPIMLFYGNQDTFMDLRELLDASELEKYSDRLIYVDRAYLDYLASDEYQDYISTGQFDENNKYAVKADNYNKDLVYEEEAPETMEDPIPIAIKIENSSKFKDTGAYDGETAAVAIIINTQKPDTSKKFLEYILE
jgi:hypothetical protein